MIVERSVRPSASVLEMHARSQGPSAETCLRSKAQRDFETEAVSEVEP